MNFLNTDADTPLRYDPAKFCAFTEEVYDDLDAYFIHKFLQLPVARVYAVQGEGKRPDLLSYRVYGSTQYWWLILLYNSLSTVEDLVEGMNINLPSIDQMETIYFQLISEESAA